MTEDSKIKNGRLLMPVLVLSLLFLLILVTVFGASDQPEFVFVELKPLSYISLVLFLVVAVLGMYSSVLYFTFLIFVMFAFPAPVNDFFPGVFLGRPLEYGASVFPFFTNVDIYLLLGIFKGLANRQPGSGKSSPLVLTVAVCLFISVLANYFSKNTTQEALLLVMGTYQLRYLLEIYLLFMLFDVKRFRYNVLLGLLFSVCFLFIEALAFTYKSNSLSLVSGSLANNTYASITAAILLFFLVIRQRFKFSLTYRLLINIAAAVAIVTVLATGSRMSVLAFTVTFFIYLYIKDRRRNILAKNASWIFSVAIFVIAVLIASSYLPKRYNPETITSKIHFNKFSTNLKEAITIEPSWETSSLMTRQELYATSVNMIVDRPLTGVGAGRWNLFKEKYGFDLFLLIDSHNGYLSALSQYGFLGLPMIYLIYFFPLFMFYRYRNSDGMNVLFCMAIINIFISVADLSNSGIFKHQIFALLAFSALSVVYFKPIRQNPESEMKEIARRS